MNAVRKRKLMLLLFFSLVLSLAFVLVVYALRQNINLFFTPSQLMEGKAPDGQHIRVGGMVVKGSIVREGTLVHFDITDYQKNVHIIYRGILPDLFREGQGIIAQGLFSKNLVFQATEVLAKHDEKYMPPEIRTMVRERRA